MTIISVIEMDEQYNVTTDAGIHAVPKGGSGELLRETLDWIAAGNAPAPFVAPVPTWKQNRLAGYQAALQGAGIDNMEELLAVMFDAQATGDATLINALKPLKDAVDTQYPAPV